MSQYRRVLTVQDISCVGQCSLTVALPILSACGAETCVLPSAVLSTHTGGFTGFTFRDLTEDMPSILAHWQKEGIDFDAIYTGYLACEEQIDRMISFFDRFGKKCLKIVDPAMGDNGKLYPAFDEAFAKHMATLCAKADIIVPNITEACVLTDTTYKEAFSPEEIYDIISKLHAMGPSRIVITGLRDGNMFTNYISELSNQHHSIDVVLPSGSDARIKTVTLPAAGTSRPGTGDIFGSVVVSGTLKGQPLEQCVQKAARFVSDCIKISDANNLPVREGTCFELLLPSLLRQE